LNEENREFSYVFLTSSVDGAPNVAGRYTEGASLDGKGTFTVQQNRPLGQEPKLAPPKPNGFAQTDQMSIAGKVKAAVKGII
jgi:Mn-containing catalase